jgi:hypothetical protein
MKPNKKASIAPIITGFVSISVGLLFRLRPKPAVIQKGRIRGIYNPIIPLKNKEALTLSIIFLQQETFLKHIPSITTRTTNPTAKGIKSSKFPPDLNIYSPISPGKIQA